MYKIPVLKSKVHRVVITETNLSGHGGITLDQSLLEAADMLAYEKVQVVNANNGLCFETFLTKGQAGSGICSLNGPDARLGQTGDIIILISYAQMGIDDLKQFKPKLVFPMQGNIL